MKRQEDYPKLLPSPNDLKDDEIKVGDLITNMATGYVWEAEYFDVQSIRPDTFEEHKKFRKMIPII